MVNKISHFSDIAIEISENQYAQTLLMSQLRSSFLLDSLQNQYKSQILFHEIRSPRDLYIVTLALLVTWHTMTINSVMSQGKKSWKGVPAPHSVTHQE